jgi:hypothetical protein
LIGASSISSNAVVSPPLIRRCPFFFHPPSPEMGTSPTKGDLPGVTIRVSCRFAEKIFPRGDSVI